MAKSKKILYSATWIILIILIVCTFLSKYISEAIMPVAEIIKPTSMILEIDDGEDEFYDKVIPSSAIIPGVNNTKHVYVVRERKGLFGPENYVVLLEAEVVSVNNIYSAIRGWNVTVFDDVVISSSRDLTSGEVVKVINQ